MIETGRRIVLVRHGETTWSASGRHTGRTDVPLTDGGENQARELSLELRAQPFALVLCSPLRRAMRTAELAGLCNADPDPDLAEWDYGGYEGLTTDQIRRSAPGWNLWRDGVPPGDDAHPGETLADVVARADRVLDRARAALPDGDVALVSHGHLLRVLAARWLDLPGSDGALLALDTATVSVLGFEREDAVIRHWNVAGRGAINGDTR